MEAYTSTYSTMFILKNSGIQKTGYFQSSTWNFVQKPQTQQISPRQVDRVVNKTHRRPSLLTTLTRHTVYYTSDDRNSLTPFVVDLL